MITTGAPAKPAAAGRDSTGLTAADYNHEYCPFRHFEPGHQTWIHLVVDTGSAPANHPLPRERRRPQSFPTAEGRWQGAGPMLVQQGRDADPNTAMPLIALHATPRSQTPCQLWAQSSLLTTAAPQTGNAIYGQEKVSKIDDAGNSMRQQMP